MGDRSNAEEEKSRSKVAELRNKIIQANGQPFLLRKTSDQGEPLYLMVSSSEYDPIEEWEGGGWNGIPTSRCMVLVNAFVEKADADGKKQLLPIGFNDSQIVEGDNVINGAMPTAEIDKLIRTGGEPIKRAYNYWKDRAVSFGVESSYQKQGLGSFMLAASMIVLDEYGARRISNMILLEPAMKTWGKFGVTEGRRTEGLAGRSILQLDPNKYTVQGFIDNPYTEQIVAAFI